MKSYRYALAYATILALSGSCIAAAQEQIALTETEKTWEILKQLEGEWLLVNPGEKDDGKLTMSYKLASVGNAILETYDPGLPTEELTVYYADGDDLRLTHYCALGNQARMTLEKTSDANKVSFSCAGPTNVESENDGHMHRMEISLIDDDHIKTVWRQYKDGKEAASYPFDLVRREKLSSEK